MSGTPGGGLVTANILGADFDIGAQVSGKLNIVVATTTTAGKVARLATSTDIANNIPGPVLDAAGINAVFASALLGALLSKLPTTPPSTSGQAWLNTGVLSVS